MRNLPTRLRHIVRLILSGGEAMMAYKFDLRRIGSDWGGGEANYERSF
jgi:hypothetical protein